MYIQLTYMYMYTVHVPTHMYIVHMYMYMYKATLQYVSTLYVVAVNMYL